MNLSIPVSVTSADYVTVVIVTSVDDVTVLIVTSADYVTEVSVTIYSAAIIKTIKSNNIYQGISE